MPRMSVMLAMTFCACATTPTPAKGSHHASRLQEIAVTEKGSEPGGEFCAGFNLDAPQVASFFDRAEPVTPERYNQDFNHLPCFVRGNARDATGPVRWGIRAGGTGWVDRADGSNILFGCKQCDDLFTGSP